MTTGKHILIVDDYPDALDIWAIYLQAMGYRVSTAGDGAVAIAQAEPFAPIYAQLTAGPAFALAS